MEKKLIITISTSPDSFGAHAENCGRIFAAGDTISDVKKDIESAIRLYKEVTPEAEWEKPIREDWPIEWRYDIPSLLNYYQGIFSHAALGRLTGINQKQLWNYANGVSTPRKAAGEKIIKALHSLGEELVQLSL